MATIENSYTNNAPRLNGGLNTGDNSSGGLLSQLGDRVSQTLAEQNKTGMTGADAVGQPPALSQQKVAWLISQISGQNVCGTICSSVI